MIENYHWTKEQDASLVRMRSKGMSWGEIGDHLDRAGHSCKRRWFQVVPKEQRRRSYHWTPEQEDTLVYMRLNGANWSEIANAIGRSGTSCKAKYERIYDPVSQVKNEVRVPIPASALADRSRRIMAPHRDISGALFGDPPIGYSALDARREARLQDACEILARSTGRLGENAAFSKEYGLPTSTVSRIKSGNWFDRLIPKNAEAST